MVSFFGSGLKRVRAVSVLPLLISRCASHSSCDFSLPVKVKAPVLMSSTSCSMPVCTRLMKSSSDRKGPFLSRSAGISCPTALSRLSMWMKPVKIFFPMILVV